VGKAEKHAFLFPATPSFESKLKNIVLNKPPTHGAGEEGQELAGTGNDQAALNTIAPYSSQLEMRVSPPGSKLENPFIRDLTLLNLM
jgi:hypothetical protein